MSWKCHLVPGPNPPGQFEWGSNITPLKFNSSPLKKQETKLVQFKITFQLGEWNKQLSTLRETDKTHLQIDDWKTMVSFLGLPVFKGELLNP